jgi:hypothetical protein
MGYTKTIQLTEEQDMFLQSELQRQKAEVFHNECDGDIGDVAQEILTILEAAPVTNLT